MLRLLREKNVVQFEHVVKELNIAYSLPKEEEHIQTRKAWSEHQLRRHCTAEKEKSLKEFYDKLVEGREEKVAAIEAELTSLEKEETAIREHLSTIKEIEGKFIPNCVGKYQPKLIEEFSEIMLHSILFYHPSPRKNFSTGVA